MDRIQKWLGAITADDFSSDSFHRLPRSGSGCASSCELCDWSTIGRIISQENVDLMVCRRGERNDKTRPTTVGEIQNLGEEGYTTLIRHAELYDDELARLSAAFAQQFGGEVNVHIYTTPAEQYGFGWHYDAEDVFILQTHGTKEYSLRKNSVHPWPLVETIPRDMQFEREIMPLMRCMLHAGDWLYIPAGYWHLGAARETSISLAVGVLSPSAINIYDFARQHLLQSLVWRQRLPNLGLASSADLARRRSDMRELLNLLTRELTQVLLDDHFVDSLLDHLEPQLAEGKPGAPEQAGSLTESQK